MNPHVSVSYTVSAQNCSAGGLAGRCRRYDAPPVSGAPELSTYAARYMDALPRFFGGAQARKYITARASTLSLPFLTKVNPVSGPAGFPLCQLELGQKLSPLFGRLAMSFDRTSFAAPFN